MTEYEEFAFYESGLSAHGCLENLDDYTKEAIHSKESAEAIEEYEKLNA